MLSTGPAFFAGHEHIEQLWVFWLAFSGLIAGLVARWLHQVNETVPQPVIETTQWSAADQLSACEICIGASTGSRIPYASITAVTMMEIRLASRR